jgi:Flp pilus assembly protein CpaB
MSRRARAIAFGLGAVFAALAAGAIADGYGRSVTRGYGALRPVVVAAARLPAGRPLSPSVAGSDLDVRQVPTRFVPTGALGDPAEALGLVPVAPIPSGAYLLGAQLRPPRTDSAGPRLAAGRRPVEITVGGAEALGLSGSSPVGTRVDVVVTTEPRDSGIGHTYVAAAGVPLLGLGPSAEGDAGGLVEATLGLTRPQALRLIAAESFARQVTVMPRGGR